MLTVGSLFAGVGGLDLGLECAGMTVRWQVEIDDYCRKVLAKHWPDVKRYEDVREVGAHNLEPVDLICGGFPCQDISNAGKRAGIEGERSGLWSEFYRIVCEVRPRYVLVENVAALSFRGLDTVLADLSLCGYDAEWQTISARSLGAPHQRDRLFIVAYRAGERCHEDGIFGRCSPQTSGQEQEARLRYWPGRTKCSSALPNRVRWLPDSQLCRVVDGLPDRLDRYRGLGNAVVPQVAEWIGSMIVKEAGY